MRDQPAYDYAVKELWNESYIYQERREAEEDIFRYQLETIAIPVQDAIQGALDAGLTESEIRSIGQDAAVKYKEHTETLKDYYETD